MLNYIRVMLSGKVLIGLGWRKSGLQHLLGTKKKIAIFVNFVQFE